VLQCLASARLHHKGTTLHKPLQKLNPGQYNPPETTLCTIMIMMKKQGVWKYVLCSIWKNIITKFSWAGLDLQEQTLLLVFFAYGTTAVMHHTGPVIPPSHFENGISHQSYTFTTLEWTLGSKGPQIYMSVNRQSINQSVNQKLVLWPCTDLYHNRKSQDFTLQMNTNAVPLSIAQIIHLTQF
jgi:hypothetical protein